MNRPLVVFTAPCLSKAIPLEWTCVVELSNEYSRPSDKGKKKHTMKNIVSGNQAVTLSPGRSFIRFSSRNRNVIFSFFYLFWVILLTIWMLIHRNMWVIFKRFFMDYHLLCFFFYCCFSLYLTGKCFEIVTPFGSIYTFRSRERKNTPIYF